MFKCQFLNVVERTTGRRSICVKEIGDLSQVEISMGSLILSCGQPNFYPLPLPVRHYCYCCCYALSECWCRQMRVQHQPGLRGGQPPQHLTLIIQLLFISFMRDGGRVTIWHCHLPSRYHQFMTTNHPSCYWARTAPGLLNLAWVSKTNPGVKSGKLNRRILVFKQKFFICSDFLAESLLIRKL